MGLSRSEIEILIKLRNEAEAGFRKLSGQVAELTGETKKASVAQDQHAEALKRNQATATATGVVFAQLAMTVGSRLVGGVQECINAANRLDAGLIGLSSVARAFNQDAGKASDTAKELAADGLMSVGDAATGLKNLLAAGFGLEEARTLMLRFKDSAALGRQGALSFGEAIRGATEGIKNGNSILVDNAGVTKNLSQMLVEAGFSAQDLSKASSDVNVRMALYKGILKETNPQIGDTARLLDTSAGAQARFSSEVETAQQKIGKALQPALSSLLGLLTPIAKIIGDNAQAFVHMSAAVAAVVLPLAAVKTAAALGIPTISEMGAAIKGMTEWLRTTPALAHSAATALTELSAVKTTSALTSTGAAATAASSALGQVGGQAVATGFGMTGAAIAGRAMSDAMSRTFIVAQDGSTVMQGARLLTDGYGKALLTAGTEAAGMSGRLASAWAAVQSGISTMATGAATAAKMVFSMQGLATAGLAAGAAFVGWQLGRVIAELTGLDAAIDSSINHLDALRIARAAAAKGGPDGSTSLLAQKEAELRAELQSTQAIKYGTSARAERLRQEIEAIRTDSTRLAIEDVKTRAIRAGAAANISYADAIAYNNKIELIRVATFDKSAKAQRASIDAELALGRITTEQANARRALLEAEEAGTNVRSRRIQLSDALAASEKRYRDEVAATGYSEKELQGLLRTNGDAFEDYAKKVGLSSDTIKRLKDGLKDQTEAHKKAAEAVREHADEMRKLYAELTGLGAAGASAEMLEAIGGTGGFWAASDAGLQKIREAADQAAAAYDRLGQSAQAAQQRSIVAAADIELGRRIGNSTSYQDLSFGKAFTGWGMVGSTSLAGLIGAAPSAGTAGGGPGRPGASIFGNITGMVNALPSVILGAIQGGGNVGGSVGSLFGANVLGKDGIAGALGKALGGGKIGSALGSMLGGAVPIVGSLLGGTVGKWVGGLFGGKSEGKLKGEAADSDIAAMQAKLLSTYGSLDKIREVGKQVGVDIAAAWGDKNVAGLEHFKKTLEEFEKRQQKLTAAMQEYGVTWEDLDAKAKQSHIRDVADKLATDLKRLEQAGVPADTALKKMATSYSDLAVAAVRTGQQIPQSLAATLKKLAEMGQLTEEAKRALLGLGTSTKVDLEAMSAAAQKYGIDLKALGPAFQQGQVDAQAKDIVSTFEMLTKQGADATGVLTGMKEEISAVVQQSIQFGTTIPENMRPLIEQLAKSGNLLDANGEAITDLSKLKFADPIADGFSDVVAAIDRLAEALRTDLPNAARDGARDANEALAQIRPPSHRYKVELDTGSEGEAPGTQHDVGAYIRRDHNARVHAGELIGPIGFMTNALEGAMKALGLEAGSAGLTIQPAPVILDGRQVGAVLFKTLPLAMQAAGVRL